MTQDNVDLYECSVEALADPGISPTLLDRLLYQNKNTKVWHVNQYEGLEDVRWEALHRNPVLPLLELEDPSKYTPLVQMALYRASLIYTQNARDRIQKLLLGRERQVLLSLLDSALQGGRASPFILALWAGMKQTGLIVPSHCALSTEKTARAINEMLPRIAETWPDTSTWAYAFHAAKTVLKWWYEPQPLSLGPAVFLTKMLHSVNDVTEESRYNNATWPVYHDLLLAGEKAIHYWTPTYDSFAEIPWSVLGNRFLEACKERDDSNDDL